ncbi:ExeM/NucH family extracellular endonuclease [Salipiger aestuarii]|uniref:ExeM/NucH family extracellular endonuclease n=1 Tax=Salipiger aestuarii TaxID=568098 RepID=UPI00123A96F9|nr:ExeM/NucH family extracellular endonuclease [Salipiger aestuarii]KAA8607771.1 hypothetical protein AL037_18315 [Salipiger aestuarii]
MSNLVMTGVVDGPLPGGLPKAIELFVLNDIGDLADYAIGTANNGGASDGPEFTLSGSAAAGEFIYVAFANSSGSGFSDYFGFDPDFETSALNINGDDVIELFQLGEKVDAFGEIGVDGTGTAWDHLDGWAYRGAQAGPSATFNASDWIYSGTNAIDGETTNATAVTPFPVGSYTAADPQPLVINEVLGSTTGADSEYIELVGEPGQSLAGLSLVVVEGDSGATPGTIDGQFDFADDAVIGDNGFYLVANTQAGAVYGLTPNAMLPTDFIENSSYTIALVETASIAGPAVTGSETVLDAVGVTDGGAGDAFYFDAPVVGPDGSFLPAGVGRVSDGVDTDSASDWSILSFSNDPSVNTPTAGTSGTGGGTEYADVMIHEVQGSTDLADGTLVGTAGAADVSAMAGQDVRVQAIVTQVMAGLGGYYIQEEDADADADASSSEGIFVAGDTAGLTVGDMVTVAGTVSENGGETRIAAHGVTVDSSGNALPTATVVTFPTATVLVDADGDYVANLEAYEGMLVTVPQDMAVTEMFQLDRFGTLRLSSDGQLEQFTQSNAPSVAGYTRALMDNAARSLVIDDGSAVQNPAEIKVPFLGTDGVLDGGDVIRMGDTYSGLTGVLSYSEDSASSSEEPEYRINLPTAGTLSAANPRDAEPDDVGGSLTVTSFNVLNYFTTLDAGGNSTGPDGSQGPRGANSTAEFDRQEAKLVAAINTVAADVVGLLEIENDPLGSTSLMALVSALNAAGGTYAYVDTGVVEGVMGGVVEGDAIKVGFLYNYETVSLTGDFAILDETVDSRFQTVGTQRASVAQTFTEISSGESFTAVVNHLKSKGSVVDGDTDIGDGQGNNANIRADAAAALVDWLASDPTGSGDTDALILGDLNAYAMEDAITAIRAGADGVHGTADDFTDLGEAYDPGGYSYVFDGQTGTLDYALANDSLAGQVTGATRWNINADEADVFDYNLDYGRDPSLYSDDPYRSSDHDPVLIGLDLGAGDAPVEYLVGTSGRDTLAGTDANEVLVSGAGNFDAMTGGGGADVFYFGAETRDGVCARDTITDYEVGVDSIGLATGVAVARVVQSGATVVAYFDDPAGATDAVYIRGDGITDSNITFIDDYALAFV